MINFDKGERLYFVVETKGSLFASDLRRVESAKIECGKAPFDVLNVGEPPAQYTVTTSVENLLAGIGTD